MLRLSKDIHSNQEQKNKFKKFTYHVGDVGPGGVPGLVLQLDDVQHLLGLLSVGDLLGWRHFGLSETGKSLNNLSQNHNGQEH